MRLYEIASRPATLSFNKLFHVGTMNPTDKRHGSYEGAGLSVSLHPEEWMAIAGIGGPIWQCVRPGNRFLNFLRLSKAQKKMIGDWAVEQGLATRQSIWRVYFWDDDAGEHRYFSFTNRQKAKNEAKYTEDENGKSQPPVEIPGALVGTPALAQRMVQHAPEQHMTGESGDANPDDLVAVAYAEDVMKLDGVWWNERLDPINLSAPRGVIVPSMIGHWQFTQVAA